LDAAELNRAEMVEKELDRMIEKRSRKGETDPDEREDLWVESVRRFHERAQAQRRQEWTEFHRSMVVLHGRLADEHREKAQKLLKAEPDEAKGA
jgi:hypothetical protein